MKEHRPLCFFVSSHLAALFPAYNYEPTSPNVYPSPVFVIHFYSSLREQQTDFVICGLGVLTVLTARTFEMDFTKYDHLFRQTGRIN